MQKNGLSIIKVDSLSNEGTITASRMGAANSMALPCTTGEPGYSGQGAIVFTTKDGQQTVVVGMGGYIVP